MKLRLEHRAALPHPHDAVGAPTDLHSVGELDLLDGRGDVQPVRVVVLLDCVGLEAGRAALDVQNPVEMEAAVTDELAGL